MKRLALVGETQPDPDIRLDSSLAPAEPSKGIMGIRYNPGPPSAGAVIAPCLVHSEIMILGWRDWAKRHRKVWLELEQGPRFDRLVMAISAALDGPGICLDRLLLAEQELRTGKLVVPFADELMRVQGHGFVTPRSNADLPTVGNLPGMAVQ